MARRGEAGTGRKLGAPLEQRRVAPGVTTRRGRAGLGGADTPSRGRGRPRGIGAGCPRRAGPLRRLPQAGSGGVGTGREADSAGLEPGKAMGTGAGRPGVLALLFAVCAPLRLQAEELGK